MAGWTKLDSAIVHSSIWGEDHTTRLLWITLLAMVTKDGIVSSSVGGLAHAARITRDECLAGLKILSGPDPDSRDGTTGERIEQVDGGWLLLNHANYRDTQTREQKANAARVRRYRDKQTDVTLRNVTDSDVMPCNAPSRAPVSVSVSESVKKKEKEKLAPLEDAECEALRAEWISIRRERHGIKTLTPRSWTMIVNRAKAAQVPIRQVLEALCDHGWQTWKVEYGKSRFEKEDKSASHAIPQIRHDSSLDIGDPACDCGSCKAMRRDRGIK
tara:strand:+ start:498 stop:1313 length:816 start_codon:yes stop_codon:yes gene_type:complete